MHLSSSEVLIAAVALVAATVNGALGYGFSSVTVPVALLFYAGRVLNPALVLLELFINGLALVANRRSLRAVWPRTRLLLLGAVPGVVLGTLALAHADPGNLKLFTFAILLPLILLQSAGVRRPVRSERAASIPAGVALGALYGATTISGPPLALMFNNQGLAKDEFRAALSIFRITESACTLAAYLALGILTAPAVGLAGTLAPSVLVGVPLGYLALRRIAPEPFRRACMAMDALLVAFGLARTLIDRGLLAPQAAWAGFAAVVAVEGAIVAAYVARRMKEAGRKQRGAVQDPEEVAAGALR
jgi:uncharacterized membrane protein YfcA